MWCARQARKFRMAGLCKLDKRRLVTITRGQVGGEICEIGSEEGEWPYHSEH